MSESKHFSKALRRYRLAAGQTQDDVAKLFGVSQAQISHWETGHRMPPMQKVMQIADHYGVTVDELIGRNVPKVELATGSLLSATEIDQWNHERCVHTAEGYCYRHDTTSCHREIQVVEKILSSRLSQAWHSGWEERHEGGPETEERNPYNSR